MTTQTAHIHTFDYGSSLSSATVRDLEDDTLVATADTVNEVTADSGVYACVFGESAVIAAGTYRLRAIVNGQPLNRYVTFAGVDGEVVQSSSVPLAEVLAAIDTYISSVSATTDASAATIVGFPSTLNIGDSYTDDMSADIHIFLRDSNDDPITAVGTHDVTDLDFAPELTIAQDKQVGRVKATVTWVTASPEGYLKVQIPSSESRRAAPGVAQMQLVLKWDGAEKALTKQAVTWVARV